MNGGVFHGSMDGTSYRTIYTVSATPSSTMIVLVNGAQAYHYLTYIGLSGSYCNIAEMAFYATNASVVPTTPTNLVWNVSSTNLSLSWPTGYTGWWLQFLSNALDAGLGINWLYVLGSSLTNNVAVPVDVTNGTMFYRLVY
jgi:hypothetical protein